MSAVPVVQAAIGPYDGDEIEIRNQWARVSITRNIDDEQAQGAMGHMLYVVAGDLYEPRETTKKFTTLRAALEYAWKSLAVYQEGRVSS